LLDTNALDSYRQERHHLTSPSLDKKMANIAILQSLSVTENPIPPSNDRAQSKIKIASTHANRKWTDTQKDLLMDAFLRGSTKELLLSNINVSLHNLKRGDVVKLCGATASLLYVFTTNLFLINRLISFYLAAWGTKNSCAYRPAERCKYVVLLFGVRSPLLKDWPSNTREAAMLGERGDSNAGKQNCIQKFAYCVWYALLLLSSISVLVGIKQQWTTCCCINGSLDSRRASLDGIQAQLSAKLRQRQRFGHDGDMLGQNLCWNNYWFDDYSASQIHHNQDHIDHQLFDVEEPTGKFARMTTPALLQLCALSSLLSISWCSIRC